MNERFELKAQAGAGGMGTVYKAVDRRTGGLVAVKILNVKSVSDVGRFDQEASVLQELEHPGIVRYVDHGLTSHGDPYIAMEWLEGETLEQRLARGTLPAAGGAHLAGRVLDALAAAHDRGIVHRDIKPSNIFLVGWRLFDVKLLDFGVARRVLDPKRFTRKGATVGTPLYTAPEQARGEANLDGRADIFSLGCVLFECLTGRPPFTGATAHDVMTKICIGPAPELRERCKEVDPELARLVHRMLAQDRRLRPSDGRALAREFRAMAARLGDAEETPAPVAVERGRAQQVLGFSEKRVLCGIVLTFERGRPGVTRAGEPSPVGERRPPQKTRPVSAAGTIINGRPEDELRASGIRQVAQEVGVAAEPFARGAFMLAPVAGGPIGDQVGAMARLALRLATAHPEARLCMGVGRAMLLAGLPVGDLVERLPDLLPEQPGLVRLDDVAFRLLPPRVAVREEGSARFLAPEERAEATLATVDGRTPPFFGRERELGSLLGTLEEVSEEEVARAVLVIGTAGAGKTRLCRELTARSRASERGPAVFLLRGRAETAGVTHGLLQPLFAKARIEAHADTPRAALEAGLVTWLGGLCREQPVMVLCDDLQWADRSSLQLLDAALRELRQHQFMVVGFGRPELEDQFPGLWRERNVERSRMAPLSRKVGLQLLRWHLPSPPPEAEDFVLERWEGNPYLLAELAASYRPGDPAPSEVVLGTVEARFFGLDEEPRRVLRAASLFGDTFFVEGLVALLGERSRASLDECLAVLVDRDFIRRASVEADGSYVFRQRLVREAARAMLTPADRALGEERARQWLEGAGKTLPEFLVVKIDERRATGGT